MSMDEVISWGGSLLLAVLGGIGSALWWVMKRHIQRMDEHGARIAALEQGKVGREELEAAIDRLEETHQRCAEQTCRRLDRIYELLASASQQTQPGTRAVWDDRRQR